MPRNYPDTYRHPLPNGLYYDMVRVRPGVFVMGSDAEEADDDERPEHIVRITQDYYIGAYPVTQAVWKAVMGDYNPSRFKGERRPVEKVSWQDIVEGGQDDTVPKGFLYRLNTQYPSTDEVLSGFAFSLPTEAEWEYAAKNGHYSAIKEGQSFKAIDLYAYYAGSDLLKEIGWFNQNSHLETKVVGKQLPNNLGLYDMSGNVYEWCMDSYSEFFYKSCHDRGVAIDPLFRDEEASHAVIRGGAWNYSAAYCRVSYRGSRRPSNRGVNHGFRLVLTQVQR